MGFGRDLGAALTMGLTINTEHKQAEAQHKKRAAAHERAVGAFNATYYQTGEKIQDSEATYQSAWDALIRSRARRIDDEGNLAPGWYEPVSSFTAVPRQLYLPVGVNQFCRFTSLAWTRCWAALVR